MLGGGADVGLFVWFCKRRTVAELAFLRRVLTVVVRGQGTKNVRGCGVLLAASLLLNVVVNVLVLWSSPPA